MSMLKLHADALESNVSSYHEFLTRYSKTRKIVYGFVEGRDDPCFYRGFIDYFLVDDWSVELWPAGNRKQVLDIHNEIDWSRFPKNRICFFVDKDLSILIPERLTRDENIYVTDMYSIENSIVDSQTVKRVLGEVFGFSKARHSEMDGVGSYFEDQLERFLVAMIPVMAQILRWRRTKADANLSDIKLESLLVVEAGSVKIDDSAVGMRAAREYIHLATKCDFVQSDDISHEIREFHANSHHRSFVRGKYVLWFMVEFCKSVRDSYEQFFTGYKRQPKMNVSISAKNAVTIIGNRARIPRSLRGFLAHNYGDYIQSRLVS